VSEVRSGGVEVGRNEALREIAPAKVEKEGEGYDSALAWWIPFFCILLSAPLGRILSLPQPAGHVAAPDPRPPSA
jgi:hypothetical protein